MGLCDTLTAITGIAVGLQIVVGLILFARAIGKEEARQRQAWQVPADATVTLVSLRDASAEGTQVTVSVDVDVEVANAAYRSPESFRLTGQRFYFPLLWMNRLDPGLKLRAQVSSDRTMLRVFLPDGTKIAG